MALRSFADLLAVVRYLRDLADSLPGWLRAFLWPKTDPVDFRLLGDQRKRMATECAALRNLEQTTEVFSSEVQLRIQIEEAPVWLALLKIALLYRKINKINRSLF